MFPFSLGISLKGQKQSATSCVLAYCKADADRCGERGWMKGARVELDEE